MNDDERKNLDDKTRAKEDAHDKELVAYLRKIGARSLASELSDLRFRNRIVEANRWLVEYDARVSYQEMLHDKIDERLIANQAAIFDKAQNYMNVLITLGYAGFFTIWNLTKDSMHPWDMKVVAVLLGLSLFVFLIWTIASMVVSGFGVRNIGVAIRENIETREDMLEAVQNAEAANNKKAVVFQRFWLPVFLFTVASGFGAGMIVIGLLILGILKVDFSFHDLLFG